MHKTSPSARLRLLALVACLAAMPLGAAGAQDSKFVGHWDGAIEAPGKPVAISVDFAAKPGVPNAFGLLGGDANAVHPFEVELDAFFADVTVHPMPPDARAGGLRRPRRPSPPCPKWTGGCAGCASCRPR